MITPEEKIRVSDKFFKDGDWYIIEKMLSEYLEPLRDVSTIDSKQSNDVIAAELRGRQITYEQLTKFLRDCRILSKITNNQSNSFK